MRWLGVATVAVLTTAGFGSTAAPAFASNIAGTWNPSFGLQGATGDVLAVAVSGSKIYIGGSFTNFGGQPTGTYQHVAEWTGTRWISLDGGVNGNVYALTVLAGKVYVGGDFTTAGGVSAKHLATWDGHAWSDVGGVATKGGEAISGGFESLATDGTSVYVGGGQFDTAGSTAVNSIAAYTPGAGFAALGMGIQDCMSCGPNKTPGDVRALLWANGKLYAAGSFTGAGGIVTGSFASWTSTGWVTYGGGLTRFGGSSSGVVESLTTDPARPRCLSAAASTTPVALRPAASPNSPEPRGRVSASLTEDEPEHDQDGAPPDPPGDQAPPRPPGPLRAIPPRVAQRRARPIRRERITRGDPLPSPSPYPLASSSSLGSRRRPGSARRTESGRPARVVSMPSRRTIKRIMPPAFSAAARAYATAG